MRPDEVLRADGRVEQEHRRLSRRPGSGENVTMRVPLHHERAPPPGGKSSASANGKTFRRTVDGETAPVASPENPFSRPCGFSGWQFNLGGRWRFQGLA